MLTVVTGGAMSRKDEIIREKIKSAAAFGKKVFVFVPDQFSFEYDKMLYNFFGAKLFNRISVMGMNRFAQELKKNYGFSGGQPADENTKIISMYKAMKNFREEKRSLFYTKNLEKPSFVLQMLDVVANLKRNEISPQTLETVSQKFSGTLCDKLRDIGGIYGEYDKALEKLELSDGLSSIGEACEILKENRILQGSEIFFDRYDSFSADEYRLIEIMLHQCENMSVAVTLSDENNSKSNLSPFALTIKTKSQLENIARSVGIKTESIKSSQYYYNKAALTHVNANIFCLKNHPSSNNQGVNAVTAQDCYDEVEFCAAEIKRLVREEGMKYSDIAVISRQLSDYSPIIEGTFERYEIPAFIDAKEAVSKSALAIYISSVFECLKGRSFKTEKLLKMIKSPLSPFKDFEISAMEEYCYTWGVDNDMWTQPFAAAQENSGNINTVNKIRQRMVQPIVDFREKAKGCTVREMTGYLTELFEAYDLTSCANKIAKLSQGFEGEKSYITEKSTELELVREFKQIWLLFIQALYSMCENLGDEKMSVREFSDLFMLVLSGMSISNPPQRINTVTVASAEHSRLSAVKAVFVLGANADKLPAAVKKSGMFSQREIKQLCDAGVEISQSAVDAAQAERLTAYLAVTQGSDRLYVCWPKTDKKGKGLVASGIVKELVRMFGKEIEIDVSKLKIDFFCPTPRAACTKLSECINDNTTPSETLKSALEKIPECENKVRSLVENRKSKQFSLSEETAQKIFFKNSDGKSSIDLSPSSIEKYNKCPFNFFCSYGLKLETPVKYEMNGVNRGNIIHYVLENMLSVENDGNKSYNCEFESMTEDEIRQRVYALSQEYKQKKMGGDFGKNARFDNLFGRVQENAVLVVMNIQQELRNSFFKPKAFELKIENEKGEPIMRLENKNITINIIGKIDRVDTYTDSDGKTYLKVVDYKTGSVSNLFRKIFHGVSLQLIIYLLALLEGGDCADSGRLQAAGIVYTPAVYITSTTSQKEDKKLPGETENAVEVKAGFAREYVNQSLERFGLVRNDEEILFAMNNSLDKRFVPMKKNNAMELEKLLAVGEHTKEMIKNVGENLSKGIISAQPLADVTSSVILKPCSYCDYSPICGAKNAKAKRMILKSDEDKFSDTLDNFVNNLKNRNGSKEVTDDGEELD